MLKINNKIGHFFDKSLKETNIVFKNESKEVVLFITNAQRREILNTIRERLKNMFNINVYSFFYDKDHSKNIILVGNQNKISERSKIIIAKLLNKIVFAEYNLKINFVLADYYQLNLSIKNFDINEIKEKILNIIKTKESITIFSVAKKHRIQIYELALKYSKIKTKSVNIYAGKDININYKMD